MKEFIIFVCTDSTKIFFSKLRSAGLNYNLPSFFTDSYCVGVSNKHCLLTFFISSKSGHVAYQIIVEEVLTYMQGNTLNLHTPLTSGVGLN